MASPIDLRTDAQKDKDNYDAEHYDLFGHVPVPDLSGHKLCIHPAHEMLTAMLSMPGVHVEMDFNPNGMMTEDDTDVVEAKETYEAMVEFHRGRIANLEERKAFERRKAESHDGKGQRLW